MNITQNIWLVVNNENELILDGQSKILNWLYNYLIDLTAKQYEIYWDRYDEPNRGGY